MLQIKYTNIFGSCFAYNPTIVSPGMYWPNFKYKLLNVLIYRKLVIIIFTLRNVVVNIHVMFSILKNLACGMPINTKYI